jgi:uncharacterized protein YkwD
VRYVLSLGLFFVLVSCNTSPIVGPATDAPLQVSPEIQTLLGLVNQERAKPRDCGGGKKPFEAAQPLKLEATLTLLAQRHSVDLQAGDPRSDLHITPEGALHYTPGMDTFERFERENYDWLAMGENVAYRYKTPESVMQAWLASPGHCANIMNATFAEIGLGKAGDYWTQAFGTQR